MYTSRVPVEGKSSVCLICMKYRIIFLTIIIISLSQILLSCIANTSFRHEQTHAIEINTGTGGPVSPRF